jgi:hypothetical protein
MDMEKQKTALAARDEELDSPSQDQDALMAMQREVQRKFGRVVLILQQYERLVKGLVADKDLAGPISELQQIKEKQLKAVAKKTLGQVVGDLTGSIMASSAAEDESSEAEPPRVEPGLPWIKVSFRMEMREADFKYSHRKLSDLVDLRNELVHHFLERHDIWSGPGCQIALDYLEECNKQVETHYEELRNWAKHVVEAREKSASILCSPEFQDFFIHGIYPGGAGVHWPSCTIVNVLRDAEEAHATEGWTFLQDAIGFARGIEPEHIPSRYGCSSWRQVLHESGQFEIRRKQGLPGEATLTWYRTKPVER